MSLKKKMKIASLSQFFQKGNSRLKMSTGRVSGLSTAFQILTPVTAVSCSVCSTTFFPLRNAYTEFSATRWPVQSAQSAPKIHALLHCPYNNGIGFWLIRCLREITPTLQPAQLIMLNFGVDQHQKNALPAAWLTAKTQQAVWTTRVAKKNTTIGITRATLKANIMFCNNFAWTNDLPDKCHPDNCPRWQFSNSF